MAVAAVALIGVLAPLASASTPAPILKVSGTALSWTAISGVSSYQLATVRNPKTTRNTTYQVVTGTSFKPPAIPSETVNYGLEANVAGAPWASEVTITWPAALPPAPILKVSGTTLSWTAIPGVSSYQLATVRNPKTTRDTTYQVVTGTSFKPPAIPSETVNYGLEANVAGAPWASQVTISWPATTTTTTPTPPPPVAGGLIVGLVADTAGWGDASTAPRLDLVTSKTGTKWLREQLLWSTIEPQRGVFDFSYYDRYMQIAGQRGMHILALLTGATPSWTGATGDTLPADPTVYAQYVAAVVGRYGTNGTFWSTYPSLKGSAIGTWELWNEPYYATNYAPAAYANMVKAAAIAGRAADPNAKFLLSAEMQSGRDANGNSVWWDDALYQAVPDLNNYFDGVAIHPYGTDVTTLNPIVAGQAYNGYDRLRRAEDLHQQFVNHGANKPFWITEIGWSTCTNDPTNCVTPAQQATDTSTLFGYIHASWKSWIQAAFIYRYGDDAGPSSVQNGYGLTNPDGSAKPALAIFTTEAATSA